MTESISNSAQNGRNDMRWLKRLGLLFIGAAGTAAALSSVVIPLSSILIKPKLRRLHQLRSPLLGRFLRKKGYDFKPISFRSFDDKRLNGWWLLKRAERPTVIVLHGVNGNRTSMIRFAITLSQSDFNVLLFDWRAHGESEGDYVTYGFHERSDVLAAIAFMQQHYGIDPNRIGLLGLSMGAAVALQVAAANKSIRAVWADSPFASLFRVSTDVARKATGLPASIMAPIARATFKVAAYRANFNPDLVNPGEVARQIECPVTIVHGTEDELIPWNHSQTIFDMLGSSDKQLWIIEGAEHTTCFRRGGESYRQRLISFFNNAFNNSEAAEVELRSES
jgi:pimeloyl-ACP methyl ester carboxylesterase